MAEEKPSLHIDTDWKKQAQEEKRKLVEEEQKRATQPPATTAATPAAPSAAPGRAAGQKRGSREIPGATFGSLVQTLLTQALFYLGDLAMQGSEPVINLDMSKHQLDILTLLEDKTRNNLTPEEQRLLDGALYEVRMRYVTVASEYL